MTTDPGAPRTDELARNAALHALAGAIQTEGYDAFGMGRDADPERVASGVLDQHTVTWETDVNSAGVPVRRYVLRGAWEVNPTALRTALDAMPAPDPAELIRPVPARGSLVRYAGREWFVGRSTVTRQGWVSLDLVSADRDGGKRADEANGIPHFKVDAVHPPVTSPAGVPADAVQALPDEEVDRRRHPGLLHGIAETYGPHPFVRQSYKGRQIDACAHFTRISSHEASICGASADDPVHVGGRVPIGCNACGLTDVPPDHLCTLV